jgi:hypothetical protein
VNIKKILGIMGKCYDFFSKLILLFFFKKTLNGIAIKTQKKFDHSNPPQQKPVLGKK